MFLIDSHCHLNYEYEGKTAADLVQDAANDNVKILVTIGTDEASFDQVQALSEKFPNVYHTIGIHPHDSKDITPATLAAIDEHLKHPKCVALGEVGLDYYYNHSDHDIQIKGLRDQLELALSNKKPIVIHSRDGEADLLPILQEFCGRRGTDTPAGVIHCFTGTEDFARACIDLGFKIGVSGIFTFKKSAELRDSIARLPLNALMVETDSPFLAPEPHRGKKCMPFMVKHTAAKLAEVFKVSLDEVATITTANTQLVFGLNS